MVPFLVGGVNRLVNFVDDRDLCLIFQSANCEYVINYRLPGFIPQNLIGNHFGQHSRGDTTGGRGRDPVLYFASVRRGYHFLEDIKFPSLCLGSWSFPSGGMGVWIRLIEGGGSWVGAGGMG